MKPWKKKYNKNKSYKKLWKKRNNKNKSCKKNWKKRKKLVKAVEQLLDSLISSFGFWLFAASSSLVIYWSSETKPRTKRTEEMQS